MQRDNCSLSEELSQLKQSSEELTEKDEELKLRVEELEGELREAKSTVETSMTARIWDLNKSFNNSLCFF